MSGGQDGFGVQNGTTAVVTSTRLALTQRYLPWDGGRSSLASDNPVKGLHETGQSRASGLPWLNWRHSQSCSKECETDQSRGFHGEENLDDY